jgi:hypothetical protein
MNPSKTARKSIVGWDYHSRIIPLLSSMKPAIHICNVQFSCYIINCAGYDPNISLKEDDVAALQALYGASEADNELGSKEEDSPPPSVDSPSVNQPSNEICSPDFQLDAIFRTIDNKTYVFSGRKFWKLNDVNIKTRAWGGYFQ